MNWDSFSNWWWPFLFIFLAGALPTYLFRVMGCWSAGVYERIQSFLFSCAALQRLWLRVLSHSLFSIKRRTGQFPVWLRTGSAVAGFAAFLIADKRLLVGVLVTEILLVIGLLTL